jgi:hypothetical protein
MDIHEYAREIILVIILLIATLLLVTRLWYDVTIATGAIFMMLALGGLFLTLSARIRALGRNIQARDKATRANLEEIAQKMIEKHDATVTHLDEVVAEFNKRIYR